MTDRSKRAIRRAVGRLRVYAILIKDLEGEYDSEYKPCDLGRPNGLAIRIDDDLAAATIDEQLERNLTANPIERATFMEAVKILGPQQTHPRTRAILIAAHDAASNADYIQQESSA